MRKNVTIQFAGREIVLITLLIGLLSLPAIIGFFWSNSSETRRQENRTSTPFPPLNQVRKNPKAFIVSLDAFLNDRIGFRHYANTLYRKVKYYVFHDPPSSNINIGKDGLVFMNSHRLDRINFVFNLLCEQQVDATLDLTNAMDTTLTAVSRFYEGQGYSVTIAAAPTNIAIYPDKLPREVDQKYRDACNSYGPRNGLLFQLADKGRMSGAYRIYYPYELFRKHRDEPYFYPKEKWHWTGKSAYLYARDLAYQTGIMDTLQLDDPAKVDVVDDDLWMFFGFSRKIKAYRYDYEKFHTTIEAPMWQFSMTSQGGLVHYQTPNALTSKRGLLLANSFGLDLAPHLASVFKDLYYFNLNVIEQSDEEVTFSNIAKHTNPDHIYVLFDDAGVIAAPDRLAAFVRLLAKQKEQVSPAL